MVLYDLCCCLAARSHDEAESEVGVGAAAERVVKNGGEKTAEKYCRKRSGHALQDTALDLTFRSQDSANVSPRDTGEAKQRKLLA